MIETTADPTIPPGYYREYDLWLYLTADGTLYFGSDQHPQRAAARGNGARGPGRLCFP
jgi:hypothetical protein